MVFMLEDGHFCSSGNMRCPCSFGQNKRYKESALFDSALMTVLLLICNSYASWSTWFISLKLCMGLSIFHSISFLLNFTFLFNKKHGLFDFKT